MTRGEALARLMNESAARVLSGAERPYEIAIEAAGVLAYFDAEGQESTASVSAYLIWAEIGDLLDDPQGPQSEELCNALASDFSRRWQALVKSESEPEQSKFMDSFRVFFDKRIREYQATH